MENYFATLNINYINQLKLRPDVMEFLKKNHYSKTFPRNSRHTFELVQNGKLIGAGIIATPISKNAPKGLLELRRLCLIDDTPKNTESWFIARILKHIKKMKVCTGIVSYADPEHGHEGIIYKASNFQYMGLQKKSNYTYTFNGKNYHVREVYQKGTKTYTILQNALKLGQVKKRMMKPKHVYIYKFDRELV